MRISVICPVLNEKKLIKDVVETLLLMPPIEKQIIYIDGGSIDGTYEYIEKVAKTDSKIELLKNEHRYVSYALNLAIPKCNGEIIVRVDAHSQYAKDYLLKILSTFHHVDTDIVGGPTRTRFLTQSQEAIAHVISHKFGIGGSKVHDKEYEGYTDSVTFGAWKHDVFNRIGLFDERLIRNQDDEFHYRALNLGLKIYQNPEIKVWYYPRETFSGLFKQYFQYGFYKPLVLKKIKSGFKLRHIVPSLWVLYLIMTSIFWSLINWVIFAPLLIYLAMTIIISLCAQKPVRVKARIFIAFIILHIAYGLGFITGIPKAFEKESN